MALSDADALGRDRASNGARFAAIGGTSPALGNDSLKPGRAFWRLLLRCAPGRPWGRRGRHRPGQRLIDPLLTHRSEGEGYE